jgi:hypothetical protein
MCYNTRNLSDLSNSLSNDLTAGKGISHSELMSWGGTCLASRRPQSDTAVLKAIVRISVQVDNITQQIC